MKFTLIIPDDMDAQIQQRGQRVPAAREMLERYLYLIAIGRRALQSRFSTEELSLIADSCNGTIFQAWSIAMLYANVEDSINLDRIDEKWQVDGPALVEKLKGLTQVEAFALADAVERFWFTTSEGKNPALADLLNYTDKQTSRPEMSGR